MENTDQIPSTPQLTSSENPEKLFDVNLFHTKIDEVLDDKTIKLKNIPEKWNKIKMWWLNLIKQGSLEDFYGISEKEPYFRVFHGTNLKKVELIVKDGKMKAFPEKEWMEPRIFATSTPTNAIWHATENGPHDTLRKEKKINETYNPKEAILLLIEMPKIWLSKNDEATKIRPARLQKWHRELIEREGGPKYPDKESNLDVFIRVMKNIAKKAESGESDTDFGFELPVNNIPLEYIFIIDEEKNKIPIKQYFEQLK